MNKQRRKTLQEIYDIIANAKDNLEEVLSVEEEYRYNMLENLQSSERYEKAEEAYSNLEDAVSYLEEVLYYIETAMEKINKPSGGGYSTAENGGYYEKVF